MCTDGEESSRHYCSVWALAGYNYEVYAFLIVSTNKIGKIQNLYFTLNTGNFQYFT